MKRKMMERLLLHDVGEIELENNKPLQNLELEPEDEKEYKVEKESAELHVERLELLGSLLFVDKNKVH